MPSDPKQAILSCKRDAKLKDVADVLKTFFVPSTDANQLVNPRLEKEREKQLERRHQASEAGRISATKRQRNSNDRSTTVQRPLDSRCDSVATNTSTEFNPSSSSSSSSSSAKKEYEIVFSVDETRTKGDDLTFPTAPPENVRRFIDAYPKKTKKTLVADAFHRATAVVMAERSMSAMVAEEWLIAKAVEYAASPAGKNPDRDKIPNPAAWLDEGRYDDGPGEWDLKKPTDKFNQKPKIKPLSEEQQELRSWNPL